MIRKKLKESRENQTRAETVEKNTHTKGECLNATIVESSTTLPNTA